MKNHWVQEHERKQNRWWSAEFARNGVFLLKPRRVRIPNASAVLSVEPNTIQIIFHFDPTGDNELLSFLKEARQSMANMYSRLRLFTGIFPKATEFENYELTALAYNHMGGGWVVSDVVLDFDFQHLRKYS